MKKVITFAPVIETQPRLGEMAEWSIAAVLKTVEGNTSGGSNPSLSAKKSKKTKSSKLQCSLLLFPFKGKQEKI